MNGQKGSTTEPSLTIAYSTDRRLHPPPAWLFRLTLVCAVTPLLISTLWILQFRKSPTHVLSKLGVIVLTAGMITVAVGVVAVFCYHVRAHTFTAGRHFYCRRARWLLWLLLFDLVMLAAYSLAGIEILALPAYRLRIINASNRDVLQSWIVSGNSRVGVHMLRKGWQLYPVELALEGGPLQLIIDNGVSVQVHEMLRHADRFSMDASVVHEIRLTEDSVELNPPKYAPAATQAQSQ